VRNRISFVGNLQIWCALSKPLFVPRDQEGACVGETHSTPRSEGLASELSGSCVAEVLDGAGLLSD